VIFQYFYTFSRLSMERNPFSAKNQTMRSYRVLYFVYEVGIISSYSNRAFSRFIAKSY